MDAQRNRRRIAQFADREAFVILVLATAALLLSSFARLEIGTDSWYALVGGRYVRSHWLPHHDTLTLLTQGRDWIDQQWFAHLVLYGLWRLGGWPLALVVLVLVSVGAFAVAAATARRLGASPRSTALVLLPCFLVGFTNTAYRAQTLSYLLFIGVALLLLTDERRPSHQIWLVFPLLVLWANIHGSVVLGAGLVSLRGLVDLVDAAWQRRESRLLRGVGLLVVPWLCTVASPYGFALPGYYRRVLDNPTLSHLIAQWQPATLRNQPQFFVLLGFGLWLVARERRSLSPFARLAFLVFAVVGLSALRNVVWFSLLAAALLPSALDTAWPTRPSVRRPQLNLAIVAVAAIALLVTVISVASHGRSWYERDYPKPAGDVVANAAARDAKLRVFADVRYADWLLFEHPELRGRLAYDVRYELLTAHEFRRLDDFSNQRGLQWASIARGYRLLVLDPHRERPVIRYFVAQRGAKTLYRSKVVAVLELPTR